MTELRDARLRKAMEEAPDAQVQPPARVREAIRAAAHGAVQPRWRGWWSTPQRRQHGVRWVAFASVAVLVAGAVLSERWALPWLQQEPRLAQAPTPVPAPLPAPGPREQVAMAPAPAPAPAPAREMAPQPPAAPQAGGAPSRERAGSARAPVRPDAPQAPPDPAARRPSPAEPPGGVAAAPPPPAAADVLAKAAPSEARSPAGASAEATPPPSAAPAAPAAPPTFAQAPAPRAVAPAAPAAALRASPGALPWTQVRIESGGRSVVVPRMQAGELAALVTSMLASPSDDAEPGPAGSLRLELAQGDESAGVLELVGDRWRWTSLRESRRPRLLKPDAGVAAALRGEAERLLRN